MTCPWPNYIRTVLFGSPIEIIHNMTLLPVKTGTQQDGTVVTSQNLRKVTSKKYLKRTSVLLKCQLGQSQEWQERALAIWNFFQTSAQQINFDKLGKQNLLSFFQWRFLLYHKSAWISTNQRLQVNSRGLHLWPYFWWFYDGNGFIRPFN